MRYGTPLAFAAAVLVAACADGAAAAEPVPTDRIDMPRSYLFAPPVVEVAAGTSLTWTNSDGFTHTVLLEGESGNGRVVAPGESTAIRFEAPGTFPYLCAFHPTEMRGTVHVTAP